MGTGNTPCRYCGRDDIARAYNLETHEAACAQKQGQTVASNKPNQAVGGSIMAGEVCADCVDHKIEKSKTDARIDQLSRDLETANGQIEGLSHFPDVGEFVAHCTGAGCASHNTQLVEYQKQVATAALEGVSPEFVEAKAHEMGLIPDTISVPASLLGYGIPS